MHPPVDARGRRSFRRTALSGIAFAAVAAVASTKPWVGSGSTGSSADPAMTVLDQGQRYPAASAASLVLLAAWGVVLVTRGRVRRAFAVVAAVAAVGLVATVVAGYLTLPDATGSSFERLMGRRGEGAGFTGWFWVAAISSVLAVPPAMAAVRLVPTWPEMGSRYDAPEARHQTQRQGRVETERDLWDQLDEGHDPTERPAP